MLELERPSDGGSVSFKAGAEPSNSYPSYAEYSMSPCFESFRLIVFATFYMFIRMCCCFAVLIFWPFLLLFMI